MASDCNRDTGLKSQLDFAFSVFAKPYAYHVVLIQGRGLFYHKIKRADLGKLGQPSTKSRKNGTTVANGGDYAHYVCLAWKDIVGCHCMRDPVKADEAEPTSNESSPTAENEYSARRKNKAYFCVYAYPLRKKAFGKGLKRQRVAVTLTVEHLNTFAENLKFATRWRDAIRAAVQDLRPPIATERILPENGVSTGSTNSLHPLHPAPPKRLLIFVNPKSGPGKALGIFHHRVAPLLAEAAVVYELIITTRQNAAFDHVKSVDLSQWDGIVIVSGDGLIFEVINGLMQRDDWRVAIKTPLGIVPGGSGNGLAKAISHALGEPTNTNPILFSAFNLAKTRSIPMDIVRVVNSNRTIYSFLSVGWGLISDIDIESERFRSLGESRFALWALARVANLRVYRGRLSYLPVDRNQVNSKSNDCYRDNRVADSTTTATADAERLFHRTLSSYETKQQQQQVIRNRGSGGDTGRRIAASKSLPDHLNTRYDDDDDDDLEDSDSRDLDDGFCIEALELSTPTTTTAPDANGNNAVFDEDSGRVSSAEECLPDEDRRTPEDQHHESLLVPLDQPLDHRWIQREDDFVLVYLVYQTHISTSAFVAPEAAMDDGIIWMMVIRKGVSRAQLASFMMSLENGSHTKHACVEIIPVRAFRLEPMTEGGYVTVDGESVEYGAIQGEVMPSLARIMVH